MKIYWYEVLDDYMFESDGIIFKFNERGKLDDRSGYEFTNNFELFCEVIDDELEGCNHPDYVLKGPGVKVCLDCGCYT